MDIISDGLKSIYFSTRNDAGANTHKHKRIHTDTGTVSTLVTEVLATYGNEGTVRHRQTRGYGGEAVTGFYI